MSLKKTIFLVLAIAPLSVLRAQIITTFAGNGTVGSSGNGGPATVAQLFDPQTVCSDNSGNIYIPDHGNYVVRKVNSAGIISIFAGTGVEGNSGDGGPATAAQIGAPWGICSDNAGNIYISESNQVIRKINTAGIISTIAGTSGVFGYSGDGGPATMAKLFAPCGICIDNAGNIYFAEFGNQVIRRISNTGIISTVAGSGSSGYFGDGGPAVNAQLSSPTGVSVDNAGNIYIADMGNSAIRKVNSSGIITTFAGGTGIGYSGDGGPATAALLKFAFCVFVDNNGNVYISDTGNGVVRLVNNTGTINTIAGNGTIGYSGDGGPATSAQLTSPCGTCLDIAGNIYIADAGAHVIRKIGACALASILSQPGNQSICEGSTTVFVITGNNITSYQWQVNAGSGWNDIADNATYSGSSGSNLTVSGAGTSMNNYQFRCAITNTCGTIFSTAALLTVTAPVTPTLTIAALTTNICVGATAIFIATAANAGTNPTYQWKKNGVNAGANSGSYTDNNLSNGDVITCTITSASTCVTSNTATSNSITMTVTPLAPTSVTITVSNNNFCFGTPVTFTAFPVNGGPNPAYTWFKNGVNLFLNSPTYTNSSLNNGDIIMGVLGSSLACVTSGVVPSNEIVVSVTPLVTPALSITATKTSVCKGEPVIFTATPVNGGSLPVYQWKKNGTSAGTNNTTYSDNNISTGDVITCLLTSNAGCVSVPAVTSNAVTMTVFSDPVVTLDHTNTLCTGGSRQLDAGNFSSYVWNDGSTGKTLTINTTGSYYVTVTDNNGCKGSDTTKITALLPPPSGFMPPDTSICAYGSLLLKAQTGYDSYLWNAGSSVSTITVTQPGLYWLEVTDNNNCTGSDTVIVLRKDCLKGFYIPNAFTPDNDGKNDSFRPFLLGNVKHYSFSIYNRWGELIFQTKDLLRGWDGTNKGAKQDTGVFIWSCNYQFEGEEKKTEKGTVMIIR